MARLTLPSAAIDSTVQQAPLAGEAAGGYWSSLQPPPVVSGTTLLRNTGSDANRIQIVFLGDGYTASQLSTTYVEHVRGLIDYLFQDSLLTEPFGRYQNFFNIYAVNVVSNQSGADREFGDSTVDTALNATYFADGQTERLLNIDHGLASDALTAGLSGLNITADIRFVSVNADKYGGAGGSFSVFAGGNPAANEVALHELGHSFAFLADEYTAAGTGGDGGQGYSGPEPAEANVSKSSTGQKWSQWLGYNQPGIGVIGAYEGARYFEAGLYRPSSDSKMRSLGKPFDAISREQFVLRFYEFVDPIDSSTAAGSHTDIASLTVRVIDRAVISTRWTVDGKVLSDAAVETFSFAAFNIASGTHAVSALAYDATDWVRLADRSSLEEEVSWTVTLTVATIRANGTAPLVGGTLRDIMIGDGADNTMAGGAGDDELTGGAGDDTLDGGEGADKAVFADRLTDVSVRFEDGVFVIQTKTQGTDRLQNIERARFAGDEVSLVSLMPSNAPSKLIAPAGLAFAFGGNALVLGTQKFQDLTILDRPGRVTLDPSFNAGGDVVRLGKVAVQYTIAQEEAGALVSDGDSELFIPLGFKGLALIFADGARNLAVDSATGIPMIGNQALTATARQITATAQDLVLPDGDIPDVAGRLFIARGTDVAIGGNLAVFGTNGLEEVFVVSGAPALDPSFARGGDAVVFDDAASLFTARQASAAVVIAGPDETVTIPVGASGMTLDFAGDARILRVDAGTGTIYIDDQVIGDTQVALAALAAQSFVMG